MSNELGNAGFHSSLLTLDYCFRCLPKTASKSASEANSVMDSNKGKKENTKMVRRAFLKSGVIFGAFAAVSSLPFVSGGAGEILADDRVPFKKVVKTDAEWKRILTAEQYRITRKAGTEAAYSSPLNEVHGKGTFVCVCCDLPLFTSKTKFDSQTGWPSFYAPIAKTHVREKVDKTMAETRTEVLCSRCDAHLGHVFEDGPRPTGLRYCMNGVAMKFVKGS